MTSLPLVLSTDIAHSAMDRFADTVQKFLDEMPLYSSSCESHILAGFMGYRIPRCKRLAVVGELETEFDLCWECYRKYQHGDWNPE